MTHGEPHFEEADGLKICLCMCPECYRDDALQAGEIACICPYCDHHKEVSHEDGDKVGPAGGIGSVDSAGG
jgi:hypothetical protein